MRIVKEINEAFANGDVGSFDRYLAEDTRWQIIGISTITGKTNIMNSLGKNDLQEVPFVTAKEFTLEGSSIIVESRGQATRKSGSTYDAVYRDVYILENGKIRELTTYVIETI